MRLVLLPLVTVLPAVLASASVLTSYQLAAHRAPIGLLARQEQIPIPTSLTNNQSETSYAAQCSAVNSATGQQAILNDIGAVTSNSIALDTQFQNILNKLTLIDTENLNGGVRFAPTWSALAQDWTNILWASRTTATNTAAYCTEFTNVIMPFVANISTPIPISLSVELLAQFSEMATTLEAEAQTTSTAFMSLNNSMNAFTPTFSTFAMSQRTTANTTAVMLMAEIINLQIQIAEYDTTISRLATAVGATAVKPQTFPIINHLNRLNRSVQVPGGRYNEFNQPTGLNRVKLLPKLPRINQQFLH
ncbi:hypothetical protein B0H17DRAFT_1139150 [Mycena rosella]|uniref:Uncharacterized protein n=1 Tax=Mycena rosella TaxID=1033263 RepID=A0AAD7GDG9_MYCRO|nr:hypothetical protein B0H17DRAFT_1139150 [Mycena rosella]